MLLFLPIYRAATSSNPTAATFSRMITGQQRECCFSLSLGAHFYLPCSTLTASISLRRPQASVPQQRSGGYVPQGGYSQQDSYASQPQQQQQGRYAQPSQPDMRQTQGGYGAPPPPGSANQLSPSSGGEDEETKFFNDVRRLAYSRRCLSD